VARADEATTRADEAEAALRSAGRASRRPPGQVTSALACGSLATGPLEVFMHDGSAVLRHLARLDGTWEGRPAIGLPDGQVSVIAVAHDRRLVRVILAVADGTPYLKQWWQQDGRWNCWADWEDLRGDGQVVPAGVRDAAVASPAAGQFDVFALDGDGRVLHRHRGPARGKDRPWTAWRVIEAPQATAIAAASHKEHCVTLLAATGDGVRINSWDHKGAMVGWQSLSGTAATDIACSSFEPGHADFFALGADGAIAHRAVSQERDWTPWTGVPGPGPGKTVTAITTLAPVGQHPGIAALTTDGTAHYTDVPPNGGTPEWRPLPSSGANANP
jgi:hypothetical protein